MLEIDIFQLKEELENSGTTYFLREIKRIRDHIGKKKDIMGYTKDKFEFRILMEKDGKAFLSGADDKIHIPQDSKILKTENGSFIIRKSDGMVFLNTR